jgi:hypothetical protein
MLVKDSDPPKSPLKRGTLRLLLPLKKGNLRLLLPLKKSDFKTFAPPLLRGAGGDLRGKKTRLRGDRDRFDLNTYS